MISRGLFRFLGPMIVALEATPSASLAASFEWLPSEPDYGYANAAAISGDGATVVGDCSSGPESGMTEACRWRVTTGWRGLGFLPGHEISKATGVSVNGDIVVGDSSDDSEFEVTSNAAAAVKKTRTFSSFSAASHQVVNARIFLGIHYRFADVESRKQGRAVARYVYDHYLLPVTD